MDNNDGKDNKDKKMELEVGEIEEEKNYNKKKYEEDDYYLKKKRRNTNRSPNSYSKHFSSDYSNNSYNKKNHQERRHKSNSKYLYEDKTSDKKKISNLCLRKDIEKKNINPINDKQIKKENDKEENNVYIINSYRNK